MYNKQVTVLHSILRHEVIHYIHELTGRDVELHPDLGNPGEIAWVSTDTWLASGELGTWFKPCRVRTEKGARGSWDIIHST